MQRADTASTPTRKRPDAADVLQVGTSVTAQASLMASAQQAREARKAIKVRELKVALKESGVSGRSALRNKDAMLKALSDKGVKSVAGKAVGKAIGVANPAIMAGASLMSASSAYSAARASGASQGTAVAAGALAASPHAVAAAAPSLIGKFAPAVASGLAKVALPMMAVAAGVSGARAGYKAYQEGKGAGSIAGAAALGAADSVSFGLASKAFDAMKGKPATSGVAATTTPTTPQIGHDPSTVNLAKAAGQIKGGMNPLAQHMAGKAPKKATASARGDLNGGEGEDRISTNIDDRRSAGPVPLAEEDEPNTPQPKTPYDRAVDAVGQRSADAWDRSTNMLENASGSIPGVRRGLGAYQKAAETAVGGAVDRAAAGVMARGLPEVSNMLRAPGQSPGGTGRQGSLTDSQAKQFAAASDHYSASHMGAQTQQPQSGGEGGPRGWANPAVQKAAQEARGVQQFTDWAKDAKPKEKTQ